MEDAASCSVIVCSIRECLFFFPNMQSIKILRMGKYAEGLEYCTAVNKKCPYRLFTLQPLSLLENRIILRE